MMTASNYQPPGEDSRGSGGDIQSKGVPPDTEGAGKREETEPEAKQENPGDAVSTES